MDRLPARLWLLSAILVAGTTAADDQEEPDEGLIEFLGEWAPSDLNSNDDVTSNDWLDVVDMTGPADTPEDGHDEAKDGNGND